MFCYSDATLIATGDADWPELTYDPCDEPLERVLVIVGPALSLNDLECGELIPSCC